MTLILHAAHALSENAIGSVLVRSSPEEVDINLLLLGVLYENPEKMVVEIPGRFGSSINFNDEYDQALVDSIPSLAMTISLPTFESARITVGKWLNSIICRSTFSPDTSSVEYG